MELRHLQTLIAVAEEGSFSRAAERLRIAQSAVSRTIRDLERELGRPLFDRSTHHVELTVAGQLTLDHARATVEAARAIRVVTTCPLSCDLALSEAGEAGAALLAAKRQAPPFSGAAPSSTEGRPGAVSGSLARGLGSRAAG
jgi:DNA-binding transcriptional LysR family regulator